jgi:hypothetical protein
MGLWVILAALTIAGLGHVLVGRLIVAKWRPLRLNPKGVVFPKLCPACLSRETDDAVEEKSGSRQTANYIIARRLEYWRVSVPHCSNCVSAIFWNQAIGLVAGGACIVIALVIAPPEDASISTLGYFLCGYPAWAFMNVRRKGIILGRATSTGITARIRRPEYFNALVAANSGPEQGTPVPLADNKGVWIPRK